jgi:serine/threonine-protein kinase HipA
MYKPVHAIEVRIWGEIVGAVALDPKLGYYAFEYAPGFVTSGVELAPLTMPLARAREPFVFAARTGVGLPEIRKILEHHRVL